MSVPTVLFFLELTSKRLHANMFLFGYSMASCFPKPPGFTLCSMCSDSSCVNNAFDAKPGANIRVASGRASSEKPVPNLRVDQDRLWSPWPRDKTRYFFITMTMFVEDEGWTSGYLEVASIKNPLWWLYWSRNHIFIDYHLNLWFTEGSVLSLHQVFKSKSGIPEECEISAGDCGWRVAEAVQLNFGRPQLCFPLHHFLFFFFFFCKIWMWTSAEHMTDNSVWTPFSPVSRSSSSSGHCRCGIRLSAHHFWNLQLPHLQVSLMSSWWHFLSALLLAQTAAEAEARRWFLFSAKKRERGGFETGLMVHAAIGASVVLTWLLPRQRLSRWQR